MAARESDTKSKTIASRGAEARAGLARVVEVAFTLVAAFLVLAAILVAVRDNINADNPLVKLVINIAETFDGPLSRTDGILQFDGKHKVTQDALFNWGIAAALWLVVGRIVGKIIRP